MDLNMRNSRLERLGRYVRWRSTQLAPLARVARKENILATARPAGDFSGVAQGYQVKREVVRVSNVNRERPMCVNAYQSRFKDLGGGGCS